MDEHIRTIPTRSTYVPRAARLEGTPWTAAADRILDIWDTSTGDVTVSWR